MEIALFNELFSKNFFCQQIPSVFYSCILLYNCSLEIRSYFSTESSLLFNFFFNQSLRLKNSHYGIGLYDNNKGSNVFKFTARDSPSIGEETTSFIFNIIDVLNERDCTWLKGENWSIFAEVNPKLNLFAKYCILINEIILTSI